MSSKSSTPSLSKQAEKDISRTCKNIDKKFSSGALAFDVFIKTCSSLLDVGRKSENVEFSLTEGFNDTSNGIAAVEHVKKEIGKTAETFDEMSAAMFKISPILAKFNEPIDVWYRIIANVSAASNLPPSKAATELNQLISSGNTKKASKLQQSGVIDDLGIDQKKTYTPHGMLAQIRKGSEDPRIKGASDRKLETFDGRIQQFENKWFVFKKSVVDEGLFDIARGTVKKLNDFTDSDFIMDIGGSIGESITEASKWTIEESLRPLYTNYYRATDLLDFIVDSAEDPDNPDNWDTYYVQGEERKALKRKDIFGDHTKDVDGLINNLHSYYQKLFGKKHTLSSVETTAPLEAGKKFNPATDTTVSPAPDATVATAAANKLTEAATTIIAPAAVTIIASAAAKIVTSQDNAAPEKQSGDATKNATPGLKKACAHLECIYTEASNTATSNHADTSMNRVVESLADTKIASAPTSGTAVGTSAANKLTEAATTINAPAAATIIASAAAKIVTSADNATPDKQSGDATKNATPGSQRPGASTDGTYTDAFNTARSNPAEAWMTRENTLLGLKSQEAEDFKKSYDMGATAGALKGQLDGMAGAFTDFFTTVQETGKFAYKELGAALVKQIQMQAAAMLTQFMLQAMYHGIMALIETNDQLNGRPHAAQAVAALKGMAVMGAFVTGSTLAGMAHDGMDSIPEEGTWLLNKGERVVDSRTNEDLKGYLKNGGNGGAQVNITINEPRDKDSVLSAIPELRRMIVDTVGGNIASNGSLNKTIRAYT